MYKQGMKNIVEQQSQIGGQVAGASIPGQQEDFPPVIAWPEQVSNVLGSSVKWADHGSFQAVYYSTADPESGVVTPHRRFLSGDQALVLTSDQGGEYLLGRTHDDDYWAAWQVGKVADAAWDNKDNEEAEARARVLEEYQQAVTQRNAAHAAAAAAMLARHAVYEFVVPAFEQAHADGFDEFAPGGPTDGAVEARLVLATVLNLAAARRYDYLVRRREAREAAQNCARLGVEVPEDLGPILKKQPRDF